MPMSPKKQDLVDNAALDFPYVRDDAATQGIVIRCVNENCYQLQKDSGLLFNYIPTTCQLRPPASIPTPLLSDAWQAVLLNKIATPVRNVARATVEKPRARSSSWKKSKMPKMARKPMRLDTSKRYRQFEVSRHEALAADSRSIEELRRVVFQSTEENAV